MKISTLYFILSMGIHSALFAAAAKPSAAAPQAQALVDTSTKLGRLLNTKLLALPNEKRPAAPILSLLNANLAKGKAFYQAHQDLTVAIEDQPPAEKRILNAGRICMVSSTVNPAKAASAEYQNTKAENCRRLNREFPDSHAKFQAFDHGAIFIAAQNELTAAQKELAEKASKEVLEIIGAQLIEIDTLANLINHCKPDNAE